MPKRPYPDFAYDRDKERILAQAEEDVRRVHTDPSPADALGAFYYDHPDEKQKHIVFTPRPPELAELMPRPGIDAEFEVSDPSLDTEKVQRLLTQVNALANESEHLRKSMSPDDYYEAVKARNAQIDSIERQARELGVIPAGYANFSSYAPIEHLQRRLKSALEKNKPPQ